MDKQKKKEYDAKYFAKNRDKRNQQRRDYYKANKEVETKKRKENYSKNKDMYNQSRREAYKDTNSSKYKTSKLSTWKKNGIKILDNTFDDFNSKTHCELCNKEFCEVGGKCKHNKKCLDHCHLTGYSRFTCCYTCNNYLKAIDNKRMILMLDIHRNYLTRNTYNEIQDFFEEEEEKFKCSFCSVDMTDMLDDSDKEDMKLYPYSNLTCYDCYLEEFCDENGICEM